MINTDAPKKQGRPATGRAHTPAQRMAELRARAKTQIFEGSQAPITDTPDSYLLEGIAAAYRAGNGFVVERIAAELLRRLGHNKAVTVTKTQDARGYSAAVKRMAVEMANRGEARETIRAAIKQASGRAPDPSNWLKTLARWRETV